VKWSDGGSHLEARSGRQSDDPLEMDWVSSQKGLQMLTIGKTVLKLLLLVCLSAAPLACLSITTPSDNQPKTEVNVGGDRGVTVEHRNDTPPDNRPQTEVNVGGDRGVSVEH